LLFFNGSNVVGKQVVIGASPFTFTAYVNPSRYEYGIIASKDRSGVNENQFRLEMHSDGDVALFFDGLEAKPNVPGSADANGFVSPLTTGLQIPLNKWSHIAVVRSELDFKLYVNGNVSITATAATVANHNNAEDFRIGSRYPPGTENGAEDLFPGIIRTAALYSQAFTSDEIKRAYLFKGSEIGPLGGVGGFAFNDEQPVTKVQISADSNSIYGIRSLQAFYSDKAGVIHGGFGGAPADQCFIFQLYPGEIITGAVVQYDSFVQSIKFITNQRETQVYGRDRGITSELSLPPGTALSSFSGSANWAVDSIGFNYIFLQ